MTCWDEFAHIDRWLDDLLCGQGDLGSLLTDLHLATRELDRAMVGPVEQPSNALQHINERPVQDQDDENDDDRPGQRRNELYPSHRRILAQDLADRGLVDTCGSSNAHINP